MPMFSCQWFQAGEEARGDEGAAWPDETAEGTDARPGERDWGS